MKRLFIAADLNDVTRKKLAEFTQTLTSCEGKMNFTAPENLHITLAFLGNVEDREIPEIIRTTSLAVQDETNFTFNTQGVCLTGPADSPKMIWAKVNSGVDELTAIASKISVALLRLGFKPDNKPFNAHITLVRIKHIKKLRELENAIAKSAAQDFGQTCLSAITIYESVLMPTGPIYIPLHECIFNRQQ